jgi:hypothetical protein
VEVFLRVEVQEGAILVQRRGDAEEEL